MDNMSGAQALFLILAYLLSVLFPLLAHAAYVIAIIALLRQLRSWYSRVVLCISIAVGFFFFYRLVYDWWRFYLLDAIFIVPIVAIFLRYREELRKQDLLPQAPRSENGTAGSA